MGMNHKGEISSLSCCAKPDIAVITGIGSAHIEFFDSIQDIADAKLEILDGLKENGTVILPKDDPLFNYLKEKTERAGKFNIVTFGESIDSNFKFVCDKESINGIEGRIAAPNSLVNLNLNMIGIHNGLNAAAAVAAVLTVEPEIKTELIENALEKMTNVEMRCEIKKNKGITFILDCYNANLDSGIAVLKMLENIKTKGRKIAFLGDMLEQGTKSDKNHSELGKFAAESGADLLVAVGGKSSEIKSGALSSTMSPKQVFAFDEKNNAVEFLKDNLKPDDVVLVKASRAMRLEESVGLIFKNEK